MSGMKVVVHPTTREASKNNGTLRCMLQTRYTRDDRNSVAVIPWATRMATRVSRNLLQGAGLGNETANFTIELNGYRLGERNHRSLICYDMFLEKYSRAARDRIQRSTGQPIHLLTSMVNVFVVRRAPNCDINVAFFFETVRNEKDLDQPLNQDVLQNIGDYTQRKTEDIIQDAAVEITRYIDGAFGQHTVNQLDLHLYLTRVMVLGSEENLDGFTVKNTDPVTEKDARLAVANTINFLMGSFRAQ